MRRFSLIPQLVPVAWFVALLCGCSALPKDDLLQNGDQSEPAADGKQRAPAAGLNAVAADLEAHGGQNMALALYENAAQKSGDAASFTALGDAYGRAGMTQKAIAAYRTALQKEPSNAAAMAALGAALLKTGKAGESIPLLQTAAASNKSGDVYANLGVAQLLSGDPKAAAGTLEKALDLSPKDLDIATNLALAQALSGQTGESVKLMRRIMGSPKANSRHRSNFALVLALAGLVSEAKGLADKDLPEARIDALIKRAERINGAADDKARAKLLGMAD